MKRFVAIALPLILAGCTNAISYHHAERVGVSLEAKTTEPQQPLQGTIGIKTRTVVVAPGLSNKAVPVGANPNIAGNSGDIDAAKTVPETGDAVSVISDFNLVRKTGGIWGQTILNSAFITGEAAHHTTKQSSTALAGLGAGEIGDVSVNQAMILDQIYYQLKTMAPTDTVAAQHKNNLDALAKMLPDVTARKYYRYEDPSMTNLITLTSPNVPPLKADFTGVLEYSRLLDTSLNSIQQMKDNRPVTLDGAIIDKAKMQVVLKDKAVLDGERRDFNSQIGSSPTIEQAGIYVLSGT